MSKSTLTLEPATFRKDGSAEMLFLTDSAGDEDTIICIGVAEIDSLVSALYKLRSGQVNVGDHCYAIEARP